MKNRRKDTGLSVNVNPRMFHRFLVRRLLKTKNILDCSLMEFFCGPLIFHLPLSKVLQSVAVILIGDVALFFSF